MQGLETGATTLPPERATRRAEGMRHMIEAISSELALEPLLTRLVESAVELLEADYGSIGLVQHHGDDPVVRIVAIHNMPPAELGVEIPFGVGLAGSVLRTKQPLILDRYGELERPMLPHLADHAVLGIPILWAERIIGFFGIGVQPPRRFDEDAAATLALFARHAAIAIENARLFEAERRRAARIAIINRIGRLIASSLSLEVIFQTAVEAIYEQLEFAYVAAGIVDPDDPEMLRLMAHAGLFVPHIPADYRQSIDIGIVGLVARTRQRVLINNVADDPSYLPIPGVDDVYAELVVPILVGDELLGVMNIESVRPIGPEDVEGVEVIADQLGLAMDNARLFTRTQRALAETRLLYETSRRISTAMTVDAVVEAYLEQIAARGPYTCSVVLYEIDESGARVALLLVGFWSARRGLSLEQVRFPYTRDEFDALLDAGQTITVADLHNDPRVSEETRRSHLVVGKSALAFIPLLAGSSCIGLVVLSHSQAHAWQEAELQLYQVTAAQLAAAIDSRHQHLLLGQRGQQLAVLEERRRLARELHDSVTQSLFSMSLLTQVLPDLWELDQAEARSGLLQVRDLTRSALAEMRALLFELRPAALGRQSLVQAIREYATTFEQRTGIRVTFTVSGELTRVERVEEALFRIAQEALTNVARHAHARSVRVTLQGGPPIRLSIADDGQGFHDENVGEGRFGLVSMRERAARIGAQLSIRAAAGQGTEIVLVWEGAG